MGAEMETGEALKILLTLALGPMAEMASKFLEIAPVAARLGLTLAAVVATPLIVFALVVRRNRRNESAGPDKRIRGTYRGTYRPVLR